jgi:hypothetical protein
MMHAKEAKTLSGFAAGGGGSTSIPAVTTGSVPTAVSRAMYLLKNEKISSSSFEGFPDPLSPIAGLGCTLEALSEGKIFFGSPLVLPSPLVVLTGPSFSL